MAILYISLTINLKFVFNSFFILFLGLHQCSVPQSQIYKFLIVWLDIWHAYSSTYLNSLFMVIFYLWHWPLTPRSNYWPLIYHMLLYVTLTVYFKVKLFIIWKENIIFLDMLLRVLQSFLQIKLSTTIYWNIVESGIKHHKPKPINIHMNW